MAIIDELVAILGFKIEGEENVKKFKANMDSMEKQASSFGTKVGTAIGLAGGAIITGLGVLAKSSISAGMRMEQLGVRLEGLEGSAEKAKEAMAWIKDFADKTPLGLDAVTDSYSRLKTFGIDPTNGSLQAAVDTMALAGGNADYLNGIILAMGQAWSKNKLQGEEALQLIERGVPVWDLLSEAMGKSTSELQDMSRKGKLGRAEMQLLFDAMGKRAAGSADKLSKTLSGIFTRTKARWDQFLNLIADSGYFKAFKDQIENMFVSIDEWFKDGSAKRAAEYLGGMFKSAITAIGIVVRQLVAHIKYLHANWDKFSGTLKLMAIGFAAASLAARPLLVTLGLLVLIFDDLLTYLEGGDSYFGDFVNKLKEITGMGEGVAQSIAGVGTALLALFAISPVQFTKIGWRLGKLLVSGLISLLRWAGPLLLRGILALLPYVAEGLVAIVALVSNPVGWAVMAGLVVAALATAVWYFWDEIKALWNRFIAWFASTDFGKYVLEKLQQIKEAFASFVEMHVVGVQMGIALGKGILDGITQMGGQIKDYILSLLPEKIQSWFKGPANDIADRAEAYSKQNPTGSGMSYAERYRELNLNQAISPELLAKLKADQGATNNTSTYNVQAPVTVNVQQATGAPSAVGKAISGAVQGLPMAPTRMQTGGAM